MAKKEHLKIIKKGVSVWNRWRIMNPHVRPNLIGAYLSRTNLSKAKLSKVDFRGAKLNGTSLHKADLYLADLTVSDLRNVDLSEANLSGANLSEARLNGANFSEANLCGADLSEAELREAYLSEALLMGASFKKTKLDKTNFVGNDLSETLSLSECIHDGPSVLDRSTLTKSGNLPIEFLRGCGLTDWEIESTKLYQPNLSNEEIININYKIVDLRTTQAIQINPLFISYSRPDGDFVDKVGEKLTEKGIRYWRDIHHATAGRLEKQVDRAMRLHPTVLLVLSEHSTNSDWVEHEVKKARKLEKEMGKDVICPVALDNSWESCNWPERLKEQIIEYNILDFRDWEDVSNFEDKFSKLLQGLDLFYK